VRAITKAKAKKMLVSYDRQLETGFHTHSQPLEYQKKFYKIKTSANRNEK
jgi:hypothetical protein